MSKSDSSSALAQLLSLTESAPTKKPSSKLAVESQDPAIAGAKRNKNTVTLGLDPEFEATAKKCAKLNAALKTAQSLFEEVQGEVRDYGKNKRDVYNETFRCKVTTVNVPFTVDVPEDSESKTPGIETKFVQVICSNKYSVSIDTVLAMEEDLGELFPILFKKEEEKILKKNAEGLFRKILEDLGLPEDKVEASMGLLFEERVKVSTTEDYEDEHKKLDDNIRNILDQSVTRQKPGLKFS